MNLVLGDNGIIERAKTAGEETRGTSVEEQVILWKANIEMIKHTEGTAETYENLRDRLYGEKLLTDKDIEELAKPENTNLEIIIGSKTISFKVDTTENNVPAFTTIANAPDISGFNNKDSYYVSWDLTSSPYKISEQTKISETAPTNWYDYTAGVNKWANIKTTGGENECYWVWIPRYAYKVPSKATAETIEVKFLEGTTNNPIDRSSITISNNTIQGNWNIHPAFWFDKNNDGIRTPDEELTGIWVAKYEASSSSVGTINLENERLTGDTNSLVGTGGGTDTTLKVNSVPNVTSWRGLNLNGMFTVCRNLTNSDNSLSNSTNLDSHMMKNTEWGAVAYLSSSSYGKTDINGNRVRVYNNPYYNDSTSHSTITGLAGTTATQINNGTTTNLYVYNTTEGTQASTTGNVYGIYDMAGGAWEYTASIWKGGTSNADTSELWNTVNAKYIDQYTATTNSQSSYYDNTNRYGDAVYETSSSGYSDTGSWDATYSLFPYSSYPVFVRGGPALNGSHTGVFAFHHYSGEAYTFYSFRPVVISSQ